MVRLAALLAGLSTLVICLLAEPFVGSPAAAPASRAPAAKGGEPAYALGRLLVKRKPGTIAASVEALAEARLDEKLWDTVERYAVPVGREMEHLARLRQSGLVEYAEPDYIARLTFEPNDTFFAQQWALAQIRLPAAWDVVTGSVPITIAIVDTGVLATHEDLAGKVLPGRNFAYVGKQTSKQFDATDDHGHGTHVAGIAAAASNNRQGIAGVNWGARILPVKVLNLAGWGDYSRIALGIRWAADNGGRVINLSFGDRGRSQALAEAVAYAQSKGSLIVAATGNHGGQRPGPDGWANPILYPAGFPGVLAVASTDQADGRAASSSFHDHTSIAAPGVNITSTLPYSNTLLSSASGYSSLSGTSMATPHVSGLAALIWSARPELTAADVRNILQQSAVDVGAPGWDQETGWGRIDAARAVALATTSARLTGRVLDSAGSPVAGASVSAGTIVTNTASDGRYQLAVASGTYTVSVVASGLEDLPPRVGVVVEPGGWTAADFLVPPPSSVMRNGGFESGNLAGWTITVLPPISPTVGIRGPGPIVSAEASRSGKYGVMLGFDEDLLAPDYAPVDYTSEVRLIQAATVPVGGILSYWYRLQTVDLNVTPPDPPCSFDCFSVTVRDLVGQVLTTTLQTDQGTGWRAMYHDLSAYAGQQVLVEFCLRSDTSLTTSVYLDQIALGVPLRKTFFPLVGRRGPGP